MINWNCCSCGKDCSIDNKDYYSLKDDIWAQIHPQIDGMLCMDCVENKLGRNLQKEDILPCFLTRRINLYTASILKS